MLISNYITPVMYIDPNGEFADPITLSVVATIAIVAAIAFLLYEVTGNIGLHDGPTTKDALNSLEDIFSDIKDKIREKKRELSVAIGLAIITTVERRNNGTYAIQFDDGSYYIGKGSPIRMYTSATIRGAEHGTFPTSFRFEWAESDRAAFKKEYMWMVDYGYYTANPNFYNKIWSPGRLYYWRDNGFCLYPGDYWGR